MSAALKLVGNVTTIGDMSTVAILDDLSGIEIALSDTLAGWSDARAVPPVGPLLHGPLRHQRRRAMSTDQDVTIKVGRAWFRLCAGLPPGHRGKRARKAAFADSARRFRAWLARRRIPQPADQD